MKYVTANAIKRNGVSAVREAMVEYGDGEAGISVRGKREFVVLDNKTYEYLRECELLSALAETREAIAKGEYHTDTKKHLAELKEMLKES